MALNPASKLYIKSQVIDHTATAYADGDAFGSKFSLEVHSDPGRGILLHRVIFIDLEQVTNNDLQVHLFNDDFTESTDNAAFSVADADASKYYGSVAIAAAGYTAIGSTFDWGSVDASKHIHLPGRSLYFQCESDAAFDSTGTDQITLQFVYERLN